MEWWGSGARPVVRVGNVGRVLFAALLMTAVLPLPWGGRFAAGATGQSARPG
jgi:hypothetical protein